MQVRPEFRPPVPEERNVIELTALAEKIVHNLDAGKDYSDLIVEFNDRSGCAFTIADFDSYPGATTTEEFVRFALVPYPKLHSGITDDEYIAIIEGLQSVDDMPEHERGYWETFLEINLNCQSLFDLLHSDNDLSPQQILAKARKLRPIEL